MATAKQRAWRAKFARMYGGGRKKASRTTKRGGSMARRKKGRGRSKGGMGGLLSTRNLIGTLGGAYAAPMVGIDPKIGAAAGSYLYGKQGVMGAAVGYVMAPMVLSMIPGIPGLGASKSSSSQVFY
jgi:hypothetical protein